MKKVNKKTYTKPAMEVIEVDSFFLVCVCEPAAYFSDCTGISL